MCHYDYCVYLFYVECGTYFSPVLRLSEIKVNRKKDYLKSPSKYFEFNLQSNSEERSVVCSSKQKAADRDNVGVEIKIDKKNKCSEIVMNNYSLFGKTPLCYKTEKQDGKYTAIDICTNPCEMHQTVNIKAVLESVSAPQTFKY